MTSVVVPRTTSADIDWQPPITVTIAAVVALVATVPLAIMIARPIDDLGHAAPGSAGNALGLAFILMAPLGYVLFVATAWAAMRERADHAVFVHTMRTAGRGLMPFVALSLVAIGWHAGPREALLMAAGLTIPIAAVVTIWSSAHPPVED